MHLARFDRTSAKPGDLLSLVPFPKVLLRYKGMGHGQQVIASYVEPPVGRPADVILRLCDVMRVVEHAEIA